MIARCHVISFNSTVDDSCTPYVPRAGVNRTSVRSAVPGCYDTAGVEADTWLVSTGRLVQTTTDLNTNGLRLQRAVNQIEVVVNRKPCAREFSFNNIITVQPTPARPRQLHVIENLINVNTTINNNSRFIPPSIYLLNATSIAKPHAIQQLQADVLSNAVDVTIITESWLKSHHPDSAVSIPGYSIFRQDRRKRKSGGVATYVKQGLNAHVHNQPGLYNDEIELLWVAFEFNSRSCFVGALYNLIYMTEGLNRYT